MNHLILHLILLNHMVLDGPKMQTHGILHTAVLKMSRVILVSPTPHVAGIGSFACEKAIPSFAMCFSLYPSENQVWMKIVKSSLCGWS